MSHQLSAIGGPFLCSFLQTPSVRFLEQCGDKQQVTGGGRPPWAGGGGQVRAMMAPPGSFISSREGLEMLLGGGGQGSRGGQGTHQGFGLGSRRQNAEKGFCSARGFTLLLGERSFQTVKNK